MRTLGVRGAGAGVCALLCVACSSPQPVVQTPARFGEAYRAGFAAQVLDERKDNGLRPVARELRGVSQADTGQAPSSAQDSLMGPSSTGGASGGR